MDYKIIFDNFSETRNFLFRVTPSKESPGEYFFKKVTESMHGKNRSVTCHNWFTIIPLMKEMLKDPFSMKITGTTRKNKKNSNEMKVANKGILNITLACHTSKKNKIVSGCKQRNYFNRN